MITFIQDMECMVVIMDLDSVPIDNRTIREMTIKYPGVYTTQKLKFKKLIETQILIYARDKLS